MNEAHATTTGHGLSSAAWLDTHFQCSRPGYEDSLRFVGIESGWSVFDAGSGGGFSATSSLRQDGNRCSIPSP
jgi:hypothetical protein